MPPLTIMVKPASSACNMRCKYCFYSDVANHREIASYGMMSDETLECLVRRAMVYADGVCSFAFQGGEPTLIGLDFFSKLLSFQKKYNTRNIAISNAIQTNAYAMTSEMAKFFADNKFLVGVSLDGTRETHNTLRVDSSGQGTYDEILLGIKRLKDAGADVNILCVVNQQVARRPKEVFDALAPYGFLQFIACIDPFSGETFPYSLTPALYATFLKETFELYYQAFQKGRFVSVRIFDHYIGLLLRQPPDLCSVASMCGSYFLIESDGSVYPCDFYVLDQHKMGNIHDDSLFKLDKSEVVLNFREPSIPQKCKHCHWFSLCRGGCKRDQIATDKTGEVENKWCSSYMAFFESAYSKLCEMARIIARSPERFTPYVYDQQ